MNPTTSIRRRDRLRIGILHLALIAPIVIAGYAAFWSIETLQEGSHTVFSLPLIIITPAAILGKRPLATLILRLAGHTRDRWIRIATYRAAILIPYLALGWLPVALGILTGVGWLAAFGGFLLLTSYREVTELWTLRHAPRTARVLEEPGDEQSVQRYRVEAAGDR